MSVNDCTLLPDPGALRRCLDQAEGRVVTPPPLNSATGLDQSKRAVEATRPVAEPATPSRVEPNFLTGKASRPIGVQPKNKNVIDLD
ncbi:hypothetical protein ACLBX9_31340 [Methylobacterium sp. A49B]|uniref:Uncharacterized protein n=1 Tax=Methylobacterium mesophilicum SR1.6/6 TaxID=908290 RepID=A0A6B9FMJ0_9HYPH|nr:hypothetical protein MMSR116_19295 [Methylobacterium mesophilicum SR1.6/6]